MDIPATARALAHMHCDEWQKTLPCPRCSSHARAIESALRAAQAAALREAAEVYPYPMQMGLEFFRKWLRDRASRLAKGTGEPFIP